MKRRPPCPPPAVLLALVRGTLAAEDEGPLAQHLESCARCRRALSGAAGAATADLPPGRPAAREGALDRAIQQLKAEAGPPERGGETVLFLDNPSGEFGESGEPERGDRLGQYEVIEVVGRGGMGVVVKAFDPSLHRFVAIKVLAPHLACSLAARRRFAREGRAAAAVSHEHVVAVHGVDEANGLPYLVMEYVPGISLQERLDRDGPLELREVLRIGIQVASGLAAAHAQGLVHRDIKPANILLENNVERVKITDFGLARAVDDASMTQSGVIAGTPQYMAPEQARGEALDHRADLFSLGSVLYAMCTGRPPFRAGSSLALLRRICDDTPRPIPTLNPDVPDYLVAVISVLHAKDPAARFSSAAEVAQLLSRCLAHLQHPSAHPRPRLGARYWGESARARLRRGLAAAALLLALGALNLPPVRGAFRSLAAWFRGQPTEAQLATKRSGPPARWRNDLGGSDTVLGVAFAPGGESLATACDDGTVKLWDLASSRLRAVLSGHQQRVWSVAFDPTGRLLASSGGDWHHPLQTGELILWDATTRKAKFRLLGHEALVFSVAFSPDGRTLASASWDRTVRLWDVGTGEQKAVLEGHTAPARFVAFSPDGKTLASASFDGTARLWDAATGKEQAVLSVPGSWLNCVSFSPDGSTLAVAENQGGPRPGADNPSPQEQEVHPGVVRLWDVARRRSVGVLRGHKGRVLSVAFGPDGRSLASGGGWHNQFGEVTLWDAAPRGEGDAPRGVGSDIAPHTPRPLSPSPREMVTLHHNQWVESVAFTRDGRTLASGGGYSGSPEDVKLWEVSPPH